MGRDHDFLSTSTVVVDILEVSSSKCIGVVGNGRVVKVGREL
jgi:hypothetical protein